MEESEIKEIIEKFKYSIEEVKGRVEKIEKNLKQDF